MPILPEERDAAMIAVKTEFMARLPQEFHEYVPRYWGDSDFLALANVACNVLMPRMNLLEERNRDLKNQLRGLA